MCSPRARESAACAGRRLTGVPARARAQLDGRETPVAAGATVYIAPNTVVGLRDTGAEPLSLAFIFPHTGYGTYLREWSVAEGEPVRPLTEGENAARLARARWLQVFEPD